MSGGLSSQYRADALKRFAGETPGTAPSAWWALLATGDPGDNTAIANEATGTGYARFQINANSGSAPKWALVTGTTTNSLANNDAVTFGPSGGAWSSSTPLTWYGIASATSAGNLQASGSLTAPVVVGGAGVTITFAIGQLQQSAARTP